MSDVYGFTLPFSRATGSLGWFEVTRNEIDAVKANLTSLILTNWGERVMHYYFGCNLIEFNFEQMHDNELKNKVADRILTQVNRWIPYISIDVLNILYPEEDSNLPENTLGIKIQFSLNRRPSLTGNLAIVANL